MPIPSAAWLLSLITVIAVAAPPARSAEPIELSPRHTRVAMFKNGLALIETQVELRAAEGEQTYRVAPLPPARFGSLWMAWPDDVTVADVRSVRVQGETQVPVLNVADLLRASVGRRIEVWVQDEWVAGELVSVAQAEPTPPAEPVESQPWRTTVPPASANLVVLRQDIGVVALPMTMISRVRMAEAMPDARVTQPQWRDALTFTVTPGEGGGEAADDDQARDDAPRTLTMHYLVQGLAWSPSYVVELTDEKTARMSAKAVIVNDFADLSHARAELIAGFPHLPAASMNAAMSLQPMHAMLQQLRQAAQYDAGARSNTAAGYMRQEAVYRMREQPAVASMPLTPVAGEASEDLFFFQVDDLTLNQHERLYHPLFAADVPYTHCYTWDIPDYIDEQRGYQDQPAEQEQVVWHALRLTNTTGQPWTTAPGMTMKAGRVLGQDTLHYTPPGAETDLRITQAVSLKAEQSEQEVARERQAERFFGYHYDRVTVEGELQLTSYGDKPVTVQITKTLSGEVAETTGEPDVIKLARGLRRVNPTSKLTWNVDVEPGIDGAAKLTYRYTVYVRN